MTSQEMLNMYGSGYGNGTTFEKMLDSSMRLHEIDPLTFKYCPFLEDATQLTEDAWGIFEQCVAIEKGWA
jgi:hypothetical protein